MQIAPDTQQNILYAIYFVVRHNFLAIVYGACLAFVTIWMLKKPTRGKVFLLWGFLILLFGFEYNKHIVEGLREQTLQSLITQRPSLRIEYYVTRVLTDALPFVLPAVGWFLVIFGGVLEKKKI
ncbi:hypothetical protein KC726_00705 [Candidatus Woesebacteria bacterium]|nr:hypothetical protein [Candidatus Woesebacteria bacterium]